MSKPFRTGFHAFGGLPSPQPRYACWILCVCWLAFCNATAKGQLSVLSVEDTGEKWREAQLAAIEEQLSTLGSSAASGATSEMELELKAQRKWLESWQPKQLSTDPLWEAGARPGPLGAEPIIDPNGTAASLRRKLLGAGAQPTARDTKALRAALAEQPDDLGLRQLHLHWIDQRQYRKQYADAIAESAQYLEQQLQQIEDDDDKIGLARAYCLYRLGRALIYRGLPEVVSESPLPDPEQHQARLLAAYTQLRQLLGSQIRSEFVLLDIRMLRHDGWYGRALGLLETYGDTVDPQWLLKKRRDLLRELGWQAPAREAAAVYAQEYPEEVAVEAKEG
ncbi:MAG: hypothetical protein NXI32_04530 [bacterium]|nr:hypothetical protein [bacterium]